MLAAVLGVRENNRDRNDAQVVPLGDGHTAAALAFSLEKRRVAESPRSQRSTLRRREMSLPTLAFRVSAKCAGEHWEQKPREKHPSGNRT